ncbi:MAG: T9SS type A sorting domain-containing protein [Bacteroidota bacterium]
MNKTHTIRRNSFPKRKNFFISAMLLALCLFSLNTKALNLFWVGGSGNWNDPAHWDIVSGGSGGYAVPSSPDNVYFDVNSFSASGQTVTINQFSNCNDFIWTSGQSPVLEGTLSIVINGSIVLESGMIWNFTGPLYLNDKQTGVNTVTTNGVSISGPIYFGIMGNNGLGWMLLDDLTCTNLVNVYSSVLNTNNKNVTCQNFVAGTGYTQGGLYLGNSTVTITGYYCNLGYGFVTDAGSATVKFTSSFYTSLNIENPIASGFSVGKVEWTSGSGGGLLKNNTGTIVTFNEVFFAGNGYIYGDNIYNTSLTFSAGKWYSLESYKTQTIGPAGTFTANGDAQNPITISSSSDKAYFSKASGTVTVNYVTIKNNAANGGAEFYAHSSWDYGNVSGWIFDQPVAVNLTLVSAIACYGGNATVEAAATGGNGVYTYSIDGIAAPTNIFTTSAGFHSVIVTDGNGLTASATININQNDAVGLTLTETSAIACHGGTATVTATATGGNGMYTYTIDGIAASTNIFTVTAGVHTVVVTDGNGCSATAAITINQPVELSVSAVVSGSTATVNASGSMPPYAYSIDGVIWVNSNSFTLSPGTYILCAKDACGNTKTASVTIVPQTSLAVTIAALAPFTQYPTCAFVNGGYPNIVSGLVNSVQFFPTVSGTTNGLTYSWYPATGLNNPTIANPVFTPVIAQGGCGIYGFTLIVRNSYGDEATATVDVNVINPQTPGTKPGTKYTICHREGGANPDISISVNALPAHFSNHLDCLGSCNFSCISNRELEAAAENNNKTIENAVIENTPNPFNGKTNITFRLPYANHVKIDVYDITGKRVSTMFDGESTGGQVYTTIFDGSTLPSGIYIYRMTTNEEVFTGKMILQKD